MNLKIHSKAFVLWLLLVVGTSYAQHPCIYATNNDKPAILAKIKNEPWAKAAWNNLLKSIDPYVTRHQSDFAWIISRMAMYWKTGEHFTQCYLKKETWDYGEGNAPVPTVRMPGMRTWNEYANVPLEQRTPYNETGDMKGISKTNPEKGVVIVPYKQSGHLIRGNNVEILTLAEKAAFAYWINGEIKYAKFAADIFDTWLAGTYYMNPILDPGKSSGGLGGYEPGGILGYYDYEQIHDDLQVHAAATYDLLFHYLQKNQQAIQKHTGKTLEAAVTVVFKRFIDLGMVRGGRTGNWNVNGWNMIMPSILLLDSNKYYTDNHGKEYYLQYYTTTSTKYHDALPDILKAYDPVTGLWAESPGYALGTIGSILDMAIPLLHSNINTINGNPMMQKAALAIFPWLDARGNTVNFGDGRGGPGNFTAFERLMTYYYIKNDTINAATVGAVLNKGIAAGQYDRSKSDWVGICLNTPSLAGYNRPISYDRTAYSPLHRHVTMKNGNDEQNGLMAEIYGGYQKEKHLSPNGLALQLYGKGWALAPDASGYESYWSIDYAYHQTATGSNTILPGYTSGPVSINAMEPAPADSSFTSKDALSPYYSFTDMSAGEKRRLVAIIRTSDTTGYYVDVFRSKQLDNDYLYHDLGNTLSIEDIDGKTFQKVGSLDTNYNPAYKYFTDISKVKLNKGFTATWSINVTKPALQMDMWMMADSNRELYRLQAPYTNLINTVTPNKVNIAPEGTPTIIVRQSGIDGWSHPFISVFEPHNKGAKSISNIKPLAAYTTFVALNVESNISQTENILYSIDDSLHSIGSIKFQGTFAVVSRNKAKLHSLYLGAGVALQADGYSIRASDNKPIGASLIIDEVGFLYSANATVVISIPSTKNKKAYIVKDDIKIEITSKFDNQKKQLAMILPKGYNIKLHLE